MVRYLKSVLPGSVNDQYIRGEFDRLFSYQAGYRGKLKCTLKTYSSYFVQLLKRILLDSHSFLVLLIVIFKL